MARVTVLEWQRVVRYDRGRFAGVLGPGRHRYSRRRSLLANSARLLEDHPALLHLRTLPAAGTPGATVVLTPAQR